MTATSLEVESFEPAHRLLRWLAVKHLFKPVVLTRMLLLQWLLNGGFFATLGATIAYGLTSTMGVGPWIGWGFYLVVAALFMFEVFVLRAPDHDEPGNWEAFWINMGHVVFHQAILITALVIGASFQIFLLVEMVWLLIGCVWMIAGLYHFGRPFTFSGWSSGFWQECNEQELVLDFIYHDHLGSFSQKDKQLLWDTLPQWKWSLYATVLGRRGYLRSPILLSQLEQWMALEKHPMWEASKLIHGHDIAASIATFLKMRNAPVEAESYALPL